jgi:outer membrane immunogenic protein
MLMRRLPVALLPIISAIACTQLASAADLAVKAPAVAPANAPLPNWTGFYVGGNVGGAWSKTDWTFFNGGNSEAFSHNASSWIAGGQIGYRHQFGPNWVLGVEASWSGTDLQDTSSSALNADRSGNRKLLTSSL